MATLSLSAIGSSSHEYARAVWERPQYHGRSWAVLFFGLFAIFLDGITTYGMLQFPRFSEGNPAALVTMNLLGLEAYIIYAASVSLAFVGLWLVRGPGLLAKALPTLALVFIAGKLLVGTSNTLIFVASLHYGLLY